jgi:hypothetical protein
LLAEEARLRGEIAADRDKRRRQEEHRARLMHADSLLRRHRGATRVQTLVALLALIVLTAAAVYAGHSAELRVREALALQCAKHSEGTDMAIVNCYTDRDLPTPEDML